MNLLCNLINNLKAAETRIIFKTKQNNISAGKFLADIKFLATKLVAMPQQRWVLDYRDNYSFSVALFAVLCSGRQPILLPNTQPGTLKIFHDEFDGILPVGAIHVGAIHVGAIHELPLPRANDYSPLRELNKNQTIVFFTSGSTGMPKKVVHSVERLMNEIEILELAFGTEIKDSLIYATVSQQHIYGLLFYLLWPLCAERIICCPTLNYPEDITAIIKTGQRLTLVSSPSLLSRMPDIKVDPQQVTIFSSGGHLKHPGRLPIIDVLGSTETGGVACKRSAEKNWTPLPKIHIGIDKDNQCLWVNGLIMGDQAKLNSDGTFQLLGRADRIAKIEGKRISLLEIENVLRKHEFIADAYAMAMENNRQYIGTTIVLTPAGKSYLQNAGKIALNTEFRTLLAQYFEPVALPKQFRYVDNTSPEIVEETFLNSSQVTLKLFIPDNLVFFRGHFPNTPILPGVVQVDWAIFFACKYFNIQPEKFMHIEHLKFTKIIQPKNTIFLSLTAKNGLLLCKYFNGDITYSAGKLKYL